MNNNSSSTKRYASQKAKAMEKVNEFLTNHDVTLDETAKKRLSEFEFDETTKLYKHGGSIELCNDFYGWYTSLTIYESGKSLLSKGTQRM